MTFYSQNLAVPARLKPDNAEVLKGKEIFYTIGCTEPDELAGKSVALQGLPALQYLFHGNGAESLAMSRDGGAFRCGFAHSVATNIDRTAPNSYSHLNYRAKVGRLSLRPHADQPAS